ncbi:putative enoyl reductase [Cucurbitaria berberidis CBS 394.84]|uniref:Enoyl reductase n=1 Tax=Cucurbitaria berberidis CBS 394.84 TaxID=1168544 RepID=A0A9P4LBK7_9PLEO|nr:putative enoyl reductase [Cucurbitaria berberidis CBS 394.84]KAF1848284.1 putative enoyl reductase [Cucurbitaria berberidis CBS 394.84]
MTVTGTFSPPRTQCAVVVNDEDKAIVWNGAPCPALKPEEFYIRTEAVGVNPSDTKMRGSFVTPFGILGTDYSGTVVAVGDDVKDVAVGDRICGAQHAMNANTPERGSFRQYNVSAGKIWLKLPQSISTEAGATFGAGISTAGLALKLLGLPLPDAPVEKPVQVLIYGGSTATGTIAIQLLKLANLIPIATCSPRNFELVRSYGAAECFDYREKDCAQKIREFTKSNLRYTLDCITTVESTAFCFAAMGRGGGKYVSLDPFASHAATRKTVKTDWVLGPSIFGDGSTWPAPYGRPPSAEVREFGQRLWAVAQQLVDEGKLKHHPLRVLEGGLETVLDGMDLVKSGTLSGEKVVVRLRY